MKKVIDNRFEHVYCTDCVYWLSLYNHIGYNKPTPKACVACFPYNPEDSVQRIKRPNYKEILKDNIGEY